MTGSKNLKYELLLFIGLAFGSACSVVFTPLPPRANSSPSVSPTPFVSPTPTAESPSLDRTPVASSALTNSSSSNQLVCMDVYITVSHTSKGDYLQICTDSEKYEVGPLAKGAYAMGPNGNFFVYCTNNGYVYAARVGATNLSSIGNVKDFSIIRRGVAPQLEFKFFGDNPYRVQIRELIMNQNKTLALPSYITSSN
jgi:hypothetical protein